MTVHLCVFVFNILLIVMTRFRHSLDLEVNYCQQHCFEEPLSLQHEQMSFKFEEDIRIISLYTFYPFVFIFLIKVTACTYFNNFR